MKITIIMNIVEMVENVENAFRNQPQRIVRHRQSVFISIFSQFNAFSTISTTFMIIVMFTTTTLTNIAWITCGLHCGNKYEFYYFPQCFPAWVGKRLRIKPSSIAEESCHNEIFYRTIWQILIFFVAGEEEQRQQKYVDKKVTFPECSAGCLLQPCSRVKMPQTRKQNYHRVNRQYF